MLRLQNLLLSLFKNLVPLISKLRLIWVFKPKKENQTSHVFTFVSLKFKPTLEVIIGHFIAIKLAIYWRFISNKTR